LRAFEKISLAPGETKEVVFQLSTKSLGFHNPDMKYVVEPGKYNLWVGNSSQSGVKLEFELVKK
jgi:beta-glucosidase